MTSLELIGKALALLARFDESRAALDQGLTAAREANDQLVFTGRLDDRNVVGLLKQASALLFPSLYEGFGIPPLEAMVVGCPVIASDSPAVREACGDAVRYFDPFDPMGLADQMRRNVRERKGASVEARQESVTLMTLRSLGGGDDTAPP